MNHTNPNEAVVFSSTQRSRAGRFRWEGVEACKRGLATKTAPFGDAPPGSYESYCRKQWVDGWVAWHNIEIMAIVRELERR